MKQLIVLLLILSSISIATSSFAQGQNGYTYIIQPGNKVVASTDMLEQVTKFYVYQKNTTGVDLDLVWKKLTMNLPSGWDFSLCDYGTCYAGIPDGEHQMHPVEKDSSGFLAPNIFPNGVIGTGTIIMMVWDINHPDVRDTISWVITTIAKADAPIAFEMHQSLRLYPNPYYGRVGIFFGATSNGTLSFIDLHGVSQLQIAVMQARSVNTDLSGLASGEYVVLFTSKDGSVLHSKLIKN